MGTSTNQRSPSRVPSWKIVQTILGTPHIESAMQAKEVWRAAIGDRHSALERELTQPAILEAAVIAATAPRAVLAAERFDDVLDARQSSGVVFDIARLALLKAVNAGQGASGFARELFAETVNYYVSRDLPSVTGSEGRVPSTSAAIALKNEIQEFTRSVISRGSDQIGREATSKRKLSRDEWRHFVKIALTSLKKGRQT